MVPYAKHSWLAGHSQKRQAEWLNTWILRHRNTSYAVSPPTLDNEGHTAWLIALRGSLPCYYTILFYNFIISILLLLLFSTAACKNKAGDAHRF